MNKTKLISISLTLVLIFSSIPKAAQAHRSADPPPPPPNPRTAPFSDQELKSALVIDHINDRPILVPPGGKQIYRVQGTDIYVEVSGMDLKNVPVKSVTSIRPDTYTQVCGVNIYRGGMLMAELRNRASVTYYTRYTLAPARFNWMDMRGTRTTSIFAQWTGLGQLAYPALMQRFENYGYTQAYGNLKICLYPFGCLTNYYSSRLIVNKYRTYCQ